MRSTLRFSILSTILIFASLTTKAQQPVYSPPPPPPSITFSPQPEPVENLPVTKLEFDQQTFDFGQIKQGDIVKHTFVLKNVGEVDAVLENVKPSCGCTQLKAPTAPIPPGETGEIEIEFNSAGKIGHQEKSITIIYNGEPRFDQVYFTGDVIAPSQDATTPEQH